MTDWIAVDIGNSALKACRFRDSGIDTRVRVPLADGRCDLAGAFTDFLASGRARAAVVSSVVPSLTLEVLDRIAGAVDVEPVVVSASIRLPFRMAYETPVTLGADRLAAAAGAWAWCEGNRPKAGVAIAVDAGTAVNVEVVASTSDGPTYLGGVIGPGPDLIRRAMRSGTAQLPDVAMEWPDRMVGASTQEAMQAGLLPGFVHAVDGVLREIEQELDGRPAVVATGGWGRLLSERLPRVDHVDPDLVLRGARTIGELNLRG